MAKIVISEFMDQTAVDWLAQSYEVVYDRELVNRPDELLRQVSDCDALIVRNRTQVRGALMERGKMRVVGRLGVGLDNIDCEACRQKGIKVIPATGANNISVAEYVISGLLMLFRKSYHDTGAVAAGEWPRERLVGSEIACKTLGLVGFGGIARAVAIRAKAMGMQVIAQDPFVAPANPVWTEYGVQRADNLEELLANADAISIHVPLTEESRNMFNAEILAKMKPGAILINTSRGGVVVENALAALLASGHIGGALVDVFEKEPLPAGSPLAQAKNCILTPHVAGVTRESNARVSSLIASEVAKALG